MRYLGLGLNIALATAALIAVIGLEPISRGSAVAIYALYVGGLVLAALVQSVKPPPWTRRSRFEEALRSRRSDRSTPPELLRAERDVRLALGSAGRLHSRFVPPLREIVSVRLLSRRGIELDRNPAAARAVIGDELWQLIRPDRPPPPDPRARGISERELHLVLDEVERI